jgi:tetratricopeptide (TPR) repeat protein
VGLRSLAVVVAALLLAASPVSQTPAPNAGLGRITFPTSGPDAARPAFERGVLLLHSFEYDDAIAAFREAQRLAPGFAMAYWGEALSYSQPLWYNENVGSAREVLARLGPTRAARAEKAPAPREKAYLDAVERLFGDGGRPARLQAYADRMATLVRDHADDQEATAFYALALLGTIPENARNPQISLKAGALAAGVLAKNPQHPGAAHYTLHAYDDGVNNRLGLEAARIYAKIAPASSHALHMPSHVFLPLGMWNDAVASDEASFAASVAWVKRTGRTLAQQDFHSLSWLHYEYLQQGRFSDARRLMEPVTRALAGANPRAAAGSVAGATEHAHSDINRGFDANALRNELASMRARAVVESGDWASMRGQGDFGNIDELFALGMSSVKLGEPARAVAAIEHLEKAAKSIPDPSARAVADIMADQIMGLVDIALGDRPAGLAALARAADAEAKQSRPIARPYPIKPAAELYGEALLEGGEPAKAVEQFRRALGRTPRRAAGLLGLARAAQKAGMAAEAAPTAKELLDVWQRADPGRPELAEVRRMAQ